MKQVPYDPKILTLPDQPTRMVPKKPKQKKSGACGDPRTVTKH